MRKIVPLVSLNQIENYKANGVDAVLMGSYFGATRQVAVFTLEEMLQVHEAIPVIACFNRFYFEDELKQLSYEMKTLMDHGIEEVLASDLAVLEIAYELGMKAILDTDTTMTNKADVAVMHDMGASEVVVGRELTLAEILEIVKNSKATGMHFFGFQLMSFSRRKHLSQYAEHQNITLTEGETYWLKEAKREDRYMTLEDRYGTHVFAPGVFSAVHAYPQLKQAGLHAVYFDVLGLDIEDVLFVVRSLELIEDYEQFEGIVAETMALELSKGLLYQKTENRK